MPFELIKTKIGPCFKNANSLFLVGIKTAKNFYKIHRSHFFSNSNLLLIENELVKDYVFNIDFCAGYLYFKPKANVKYENTGSVQ